MSELSRFGGMVIYMLLNSIINLMCMFTMEILRLL